MATAKQHGPCRRLEVTPSDTSLPQVAENFEAMIVIRIKVAAQMASLNPISKRLGGREHSPGVGGWVGGGTRSSGRKHIEAGWG